MHELIGQKVMIRKTKVRGIITDIKDDMIYVDFYEYISHYRFPAALADILILENQGFREKYASQSKDSSFEDFINISTKALNAEIAYLHETGGKKYRIIDGERLETNKNTFIYSFDTETEFHFPDGTTIKLWLPNGIVPAQVISCEEFTILIQPVEYIGERIETVEFTAEPWQLMESLVERIKELDVSNAPIAYDVASKGRLQIDQRKSINLGQDNALRKSTEQPITFIWGPPGTGKTTTLAKIALEHILHGKRILMLSYSNVSVDGALLKVANMSDYEKGKILRYGYPRVKELLESETLTSYAYVLYENKELAKEYKELQSERNKLRAKDPQRIEVKKKINKIRTSLLEKEKELIKRASFVATTVSKAVVDKSLYTQKFDVVIFDEASMAYIPQIVFAASLAKESFCCLGDFRQLPAIVQNPSNRFLSTDIFEYTGITSAVENGFGHEWLVMLNRQYRMHPEIAEFASKYMYGNMLESADSIYDHRQSIADMGPLEGNPMGLLDLTSMYSVCIKTMDGSRINLLSALFCVKLAEYYVEQYGVGIITPYSAQSRLILAMIRDIQERNPKFKTVKCATVHQFQGSEQPIIIYDAVDCFRMPYPGTLLTSMKNDTANRLFNVALTRTQGKFILVTNKNYMYQKKISKKLMFTKALADMTKNGYKLNGEEILNNLGTNETEIPEVFIGDRDEIDSWERYLQDINKAKKEIYISIPGVMDDDDEAIDDLANALIESESKNISVYIRKDENISISNKFEKYVHEHGYVTTPFTLIDKSILWFGEPLSAADFISEGEVLETDYFPCIRFEGKHTARMLKAIFEIPSL